MSPLNSTCGQNTLEVKYVDKKCIPFKGVGRKLGKALAPLLYFFNATSYDTFRIT